MSGSAVLQEDVNFSVDGGHAEQAPRAQRFHFTGSGSEYFRIWIVNLLLTIVTLGIYSAWAKVRRNRYFYDSTQLDGSSFEYHGNPIAILKGRVIAFVAFAAYNLSFKYSPPLGLAVLGVLLLLMPWLVWKSLQFKYYNSGYRGIRFGFRGSLGKMYLYFLVLPFLTIFSLFTLVPLVRRQAMKFQIGESRFGASHFSFTAGIWNFYKVYLIGIGALIVGLTAIGVGFAGALFAVKSAAGAPPHPNQMKYAFSMIAALYGWIFVLVPLLYTLTHNLVWNHVRLGEHLFACKLKFGKTLFIMLTNALGVLVTFGLFMPFAHVRLLKYRIESLTLIPHEDLDSFVTHEQQQVSATGEGMADMFDFDISL
jgi:uncharacterized membrane protein YjgN (DUF898 family)